MEAVSDEGEQKKKNLFPLEMLLWLMSCFKVVEKFFTLPDYC